MPTNMNIIGPPPGVNQPVQGFTSASFSEKQQTFGGAPPPSIPLINAQSPPIISGGVGVPVPIPNLPMPKPVPYVDANTDNPPYNSNEYYGFDPYGQYQGIFTTIDAIHDETQFQTTNGFSDNAMDPNWGGVLFTANQVASGKYDDNIVAPPVYSGAPNVYVDFGHSPDAFFNTLSAVRKVTKGKVLMLFGADGDRDASKRADMARVAAAGCDILVITDHHPRFENPASIRKTLVEAAKAFRPELEIHEVSPPEKAIRVAVSLVAPGDAILWAGPGHQDYRDIEGVRTPYSARAEARAALKESGY
jgi:hypothetical protein